MTQETILDLQTIVQRIIQTVDSEEIYLFGSYARSEETTESDYDIFVVLKDSERRLLECEQAPLSPTKLSPSPSIRWAECIGDGE
ncbi:MAG: nucleotidyltransferase domain-containing protein [Eubacteriales bacterium]